MSKPRVCLSRLKFCETKFQNWVCLDFSFLVLKRWVFPDFMRQPASKEPEDVPNPEPCGIHHHSDP